MKRQTKRHRIIATFFLLIFFPTLVPTNLFASNNGPKSPEAASFEPVDATDMVNLITGQYSYVLPLLNVPSPEGGYPIALGYHAGIAMDQEASWAGLGWNVNPGALQRNVNGYPDDINSPVEEFFYDEGSAETVNTLSLNYSNGATSVGVGFNWGNNQALGGYVSLGAGLNLGTGNNIGVNAKVGTQGTSLGVGFQSSGGLTLGVNISESGKLSGSIGQLDTNGSGFSISSNGVFSLKSNSLLVDASSSGVGISLSAKTVGFDNKTGAGINLSFKNTISMGDYSFSQRGWSIPLSVPTPVGFFGISYGKQTYKMYLNKRKTYSVLGPVLFSKATIGSVGTTPNFPYTPIFDVNELTISDNNDTIKSNVDTNSNNIVLPNYDNYNVNAQGLSGSVSPHIFKNGILANESTRDLSAGYKIMYPMNYGHPFATNFDETIPNEFKLDPVNFYFDNEISTYLNYTDVNSATYVNSTNLLGITRFFDLSSASGTKPKRKTSNYVEFFSVSELTNPTFLSNSLAKGFLKATQNFNYDIFGHKGNIAAFKITGIDGKTYHYSLPVYNHETVSRTQGTINGKPERNSYFEKRQLFPYVTHWLLTAVTGPDFIDNGDGVAGEGDLGYWVNFEYGLWSDAFVWKAPYKKDFLIDENNPNIKTWVRGRKQMYYLDKIKTRTHTAIFVKSPRTYESSSIWEYKQVNHNNNVANTAADYDNGLKFTIPSQSQLKLDKIILLKNEDDIIDKSKNQQSNSLTVLYAQSAKLYSYPTFNCFKNVIENLDNWQDCISKAIKVIDFGYDYSLVPGDNRLTLKSISFKGKGGTSVLPPYKFDYINDTNTFNIDNQDGWGYNATNSASFSLNKITTPQGGTIDIIYGNNKFKSVTPAMLEFSNKNSLNYTSTLPNPSPSSSTDQTAKKVIISLGNNQSYPIDLGKVVRVSYLSKFIKPGGGGTSSETTRSYIGNGQITSMPSSLGNGKYEVTFDGYPSSAITNIIPGDLYASNQNISIKIDLNNNSIFTGGGSRVESLKVSDGINNYLTDYKYGQNEDGVGYVSYVPFVQNITKELSYSSFLPTPRVMYEYVSVSSRTNNDQILEKNRYKFNVFKEKSPSKIKYGDFFEITKNSNEFTNYSVNPGNGSTSGYYGTKKVSISTFTIKDNLSSIGQLLEVAKFNSQNQLLNKILNDYYKTTDNIPNNMGIIKESFQQYKVIDYYDESINDKWIIGSSTQIKYPNIIKSSTEQKNGFTYTTQFNDYDLVSGISKEQVYTSSDGQSFKTRVVPAYTKSQYNPSGGYGMGSKVDNPTNKNMLSQIAAEYSYILDKGSNEWKETGVGITTWSNIWSYKDSAGETTTATTDKEKIWRKHKTYVWNGVKDSNGIFSHYDNTTGSGDDGFNWAVPLGVGIPILQPSQWKQVSETTLYNHFSSPLEMKDINNNYASTKMDAKDSKVLAVGNARYGEIFYTGGENNWLGSGITGGNPYTMDYGSHTGKKLIIASTASPLTVSMKNAEHRAGKYKLSVWVKGSDASRAALNLNANGNTVAIAFVADNVTAGGWQLKTAYLDIPSSASTISLSSNTSSAVYYDDLMIRPVASSITGYVYNEWDELSYIISNNGLATKFEYDAAGRLIKTYSEYVNTEYFSGGFKLSKTNAYYNRFL